METAGVEQSVNERAFVVVGTKKHAAQLGVLPYEECGFAIR